MQVSENQEALIRIMLPFKDQKLANTVSKQLGELCRKINVDISLVYTSQKVENEIKVREDNPCMVYYFKCDLCNAGYTCRHLHQRIEEHKGSAVGNYLREQDDL